MQDASPAEDSGPIGPSAEEEAALLAADPSNEQAYSLPPKADSSPEPEPGAVSLPPMEDLVKRIPGPARELIEELFRARFVTVKRVPKSALK